MTVTMPAPVTQTLTVPTALTPTEAIARLRAADAAMRANPHWLVPTDLVVDWQQTETTATGTISGIAFGFAVDGTIAAEDGAVTLAFTVPWTGKALLGAFLPRLEGSLHAILA